MTRKTQLENILDQIQADLAYYQNETDQCGMSNQSWDTKFIERVIASVTIYENLQPKTK